MAHNTFRWVVIAGAFVISLAALIFWPVGRFVAPGISGWAIQLTVAFGLPAAAVAIVALFRVLRPKDPFRENYVRFEGTFALVLDAVVVLIVGLHLALLGYLLARRPWLGSLVPLLLGGTVAFVGNLLPRVRPNSVVGIRTPWTIRDEAVWTKTHRLGGYVVTVFGLALMGAALFSFEKVWLVLVSGTAVAVLGIPAASYVLWRRSMSERSGAGEKIRPA